IQLKTIAAGYCPFAVALASLMRSRCSGLPDRKRSLPAFICWMISSAVSFSRCSLVSSAWANTLPRLASTTPIAVETLAALQKVRRSNRSRPLLNCECGIAVLLRSAFIFIRDLLFDLENGEGCTLVSLVFLQRCFDRIVPTV